MEIVVNELREIEEKYGDARRTTIVDDPGEIRIEDLIADEDMAITVSNTGYIKRTSLDSYSQQRRGGKGRRGMDLREEDFVSHIFVASTHAYIMIFSDRGRAYWLKVYEIPDVGPANRGKAIANLVSMEPGEKIAALLAVRTFPTRKISSSSSWARARAWSRRPTSRRSPTRAPAASSRMGIEEDDALLAVQQTDGKSEVLIGTRQGQSIRFPEEDVRSMGRTAYGVRGIALKEDDEVVAMEVVRPGGTVLTVTANGYGKRTALEEYRLQSRGGSGIINIQTSDRNGVVVGIAYVSDEHELMLITQQGQTLRMGAKDVRVDRPRHAGRPADRRRRGRRGRLDCPARGSGRHERERGRDRRKRGRRTHSGVQRRASHRRRTWRERCRREDVRRGRRRRVGPSPPARRAYEGARTAHRLFVAAVLLAAAARRVGAPYPVFLALGGAVLAFVPGSPQFTRPTRAGARAVHRAGAARRGVRRLAPRSPRQLGSGHRPGRLRRRADDRRRRRGRADARARAGVGAGDRARRGRRAARRRGSHRGPPAPPAAAPDPDDPRRRKPAERRQRAPDLPAGHRRRRGRRVFARGGRARRSCSPSPAASSSARCSAGSPSGSLDRVEHVPSAIILQFVTTFGVWILAEHIGLSAVLTMVSYAITVARTAPARIPARSRIPSYAVWETGRLRPQHPRLHLHRPADPADPRKPGAGRPRPLRGRRRRRAGDGDRRPARLAHVVQRRHPLARPPVRLQPAAADAARRPSAAAW